MRYCFILIFFLSFKTNAQNYLAEGDSSYKHKYYREAIFFYKKFAKEEERNVSPGISTLGATNWQIGRCFYYLNKTDSALLYYKNALPYYRKLEDWANVGVIKMDMYMAHTDARNNNLKWTKPKTKNEVVGEVYFRITKVTYFGKDSILIELNAGSNDGIMTGSNSKCIGAVKKVSDRVGWILASATVRDVKPNKTILMAQLYNKEDTLRRVFVKDVVSIYCKYNKSKKATLLQDLAAYHILFTDNYKTPLYEWRNLLDDSDSLLENDIYQKMKYDIMEIYDIIKDDSTYSKMICLDGLFKGDDLVTAMKNTDISHIRAFLQFVKAYPGKYAGINFPLADTYATWIINNCPTSANAMTDYYDNQADKRIRLKYLENYKIEIYRDKYFNTWKTEVLKNIKQNSLKQIPSQLEMLQDAGMVFGDKSYQAWYYYCRAKYFGRVKDTSVSNSNFRLALKLFYEQNDNEGIYLCNESLQKKNVATRPELILQSGHSTFFEICFSTDGKYFITGGNDRLIKLWDARLGKEIISVTAHDDEITSVAFSYDGRFVISSSKDKTVKLWDADNLKLIKSFNTGIENRKAIISKNTEFFIVCGRDSIIQMWDIKKKEIIKRFSKHRKRVYSVTWGLSDNEFFSCGADSFIYRWDIEKGNTSGWFKQKDRVITVKVSLDGKWMVTTLANGKLNVWDLNTYKTTYYFDNLISYNTDSTSKYICEPTFSNDSRYLLYGYKKNKVVIMELATGDGFIYNTTHYMAILQIQMSDDGSFFATVAKDFKINLFDFQDYVFDTKYSFRKIEIKGHNEGGSTVEFGEDNSLLIFGTTFRKYNLSTGKAEVLINYLPFGIATKYIFDSQHKNVVGISGNLQTVFKFNLENKIIDTLYTSPTILKNIDYDYETERLYAYDESDRLFLVMKGQIVKSIIAEIPDTAYKGLLYNKSLNKILIAGYDFIDEYDMDLNFVSKIADFKDTTSFFFAGATGEYIARAGITGLVDIIELRSGKVLRTLITDSSFHETALSLSFSPDDSLVLIGHNNYEVQIWNWRNDVKPVKHYGHHSYILSVAASVNGKYFASSSLDSKIILYDLEQKKFLCTLYPMTDRGVLTITDSSYYMAPRSCYDGFVFKMNNQIYTPEQFDLQYHRPDLVMKKIGTADDDIILTYRSAYLKRINRNGMDENSISFSMHMPKIEIESKESLPITTSQNKIALKVIAEDPFYDLKSIRVWVNNIPVFGQKGLIIPSTSEIKKEIEIPMQNGTNRIKIAALNQKGIESLKEYYQIECSYLDTTQRSKTYLVVISVSKYKDTSHNLTYAAKDGRDIISGFSEKFKNLVVDSFINENATKEKIMALKTKLMKTGVNDKVIVFISGHGLLDHKFNFYFATHDLNFRRPEERGISYEQINELLDGIPARKKLLLMDACHSGEVDKEAVNQRKVAEKDTANRKVDYAKKGGRLVNRQKVKLQNSFDLMQDLFSDMSSTNGAAVISAARGTGYALESSIWNNGVFTYALLRGLQNYKADADSDYSIKLSELSAYIIHEVDVLTNGSQKPTSRAENLEYDWEVW